MKRATLSKAKEPKTKAKAPKVTAPKAVSTVFRLNSPAAKKVSLAGNFNNWDSGALSAKKDTKGVWSVKVSLKPGRYEYKFVVDGAWITDPAAGTVYNTYGSQNSVIEVK